LFADQEPTTVELAAVSEDIPKSPSWTPSYSTSVQGPGLRSESETILADDSEPSDNVPTTIQDTEPVTAPAEPAAAAEISEPTTIEDDETPATPTVDAPSEEPSDVFDPSLGQARLAQPEEVEADRPKSEWTPSYAVTTLPGSGSSPRVDSKPELDEARTVETEVEVPPAEKIEAAETPEIVTPADEEPTEPTATTETPWAQSYSVISQPGSPRVSPKAGPEELEPQPVEPVQETSATVPVVELADVPKTVVTPAVEREDENIAEPVLEEESKPTWTQSYSVISQPGSPRISPKQVPEEIPEVEEAKPSWTQSYSVTSQPGSPRILPKDNLPEPTIEPVVDADEPILVVVTPPVEEAPPAPVEAEVPERPESPWTPSHSAATLEGQAEQAPPEDAEPEPEVVSIPKTLVEEAPEPKPETDAPVTDTPLPEAPAIGQEQEKLPESSWTPSYSVTTLSGSARAEEPEPGSDVGKPTVDVGVPVPEPVGVMRAAEDQPKENGTTSDVFEAHEAVAQLAVHDGPQVGVKTPELAPPQLDLVSLGCFCPTIRSILTVMFN